jgi:hypothetical protein
MKPWSSKPYLLPKLALQQYSIRGPQFLQLQIQFRGDMMTLRYVNICKITVLPPISIFQKSGNYFIDLDNL